MVLPLVNDISAISGQLAPLVPCNPVQQGITRNPPTPATKRNYWTVNVAVDLVTFPELVQF
jgi:hypothetical protein